MPNVDATTPGLMSAKSSTAKFAARLPKGTPESKQAGEELRVLHLNAGNLYGGVETFLVTLAQQRDCCPGMQSIFGLCFSGRFHSELEAAGAEVYRLGEVKLSRPWGVWAARRRLRQILRQHRFHVAVCHMSWSHSIFGSTLRRAEVPLVHWAHGTTLGRHWLERAAGRTKPDLVICNSNSTAESVPNLFPNTETTVVRCAVRTDPWRGAREEVRRELNTSPSSTVVIQVSRMEEWKGHRTLIEALARLDSPSDWIYWVVGGAQRPAEQEYQAGLARRAKELGLGDRVRFLGQRSDVRRLLAAADLFCQPNLEPEPFGLVFIEALSAGLPIVTTAIGGSRDIVTPECGLLVQPADESGLARALARLLGDPAYRRQLGQAGPVQAAALCDPERQMQSMAQVLKRLVK